MSDDLKLLKEQIYVDERVEELLEKLGCLHIKKESMGKMYTACLPNGSNRRSVQVKLNPSLTTNIRSKGISGDIYSLVGYILYNCTDFEHVKKHLFEIKNWICKQLDYEQFLSAKDSDTSIPYDYNGWLRKLKKKREQDAKKEMDEQFNRVRDESILNQFHMYPNIWWKNEGLKYSTQVEFEVGFDINSERIIFPVRNVDGELIGVKGRYIGQDEYINKEKKYLYLYSCNKSIEFFNLHRAMPYIMKKKEVIIFEGGKSTMFAHQFGFKNTVSIEGDELSSYQVEILLNLGLDVEIIFAYDKDKDSKFVRQQASLIQSRRVYAIFDTKGLLTGEKYSPIDRGKDVWETLYVNHKYKIH